jgi:hypothetical protein
VRTALLVALFYTLVTLAWLELGHTGQQAHNLGTMAAIGVLCYRRPE